MNDQVGMGRRRMPRDLLVGPLGHAVLRLLVVLDAASRIAEYDDATDIGSRERERPAVEKDARLARRRGRLAGQHGEGCQPNIRRRVVQGGVARGAHLHFEIGSVGFERRAARVVGDYPDARIPGRPDELNPGGERFRRGRFWPEHKRESERAKGERSLTRS
jgi:hypothetical protein